MTKKLADLKQRCPVPDEPARKGVTQIMDTKVLDTSPFTGTGKRGFNVLDLITDTDAAPLPFMEKHKRRSGADSFAMAQSSDQDLPCLLIDRNGLPLSTFGLL